MPPSPGKRVPGPLHALFIGIAVLIAGCTSVPKGITPVQDFSADRYLGRWFEIARLDHSFERGLDNVTAEYSRREDGGIHVVNRGFSREEGEWKEAVGRAYFVDRQDLGHLKVSFFGPFYASYVVFELDRGYQYAFVTGYDRSYLWLLARTPGVEPEVRQQFEETAARLGFAVDQLIWVRH
jgi:apolipoprotein D and lipocalin family protein